MLSHEAIPPEVNMFTTSCKKQKALLIPTVCSSFTLRDILALILIGQLKRDMKCSKSYRIKRTSSYLVGDRSVFSRYQVHKF